MDFANYWASATATADLGDTIEQSLRFPNTPISTENALLTKTGVTSSTWTASFWVKYAGLANGYIFSQAGSEGFRGGNSTGDSRPNYFVDSNHRYLLGEANDPSAWYHYVISYDGSNIKVYLNGTLDLTYATSNGNISVNRIGGYNGSIAFSGYLAAFYWVDGSALLPTSFGKYNNDGVWVPQNYSGSFGTNGWKLTFDSSQANGIGHDSSGNGNHWTASGFDTAAISSSNTDNDVDFKDTPTSNYATLNGVLPSGTTELVNANLKTQSSSGYKATAATCGYLSSGSWFWQVKREENGGYAGVIAQVDGEAPQNFLGTSGFPAYSIGLDMSTYSGKAVYYYNATATAGSGHVSVNYGSTSVTANSIVVVRLDIDNTRIAWDIDGTTGAWVDYSTHFGDVPVIPYLAGTTTMDVSHNFGQMPFIYTAPTGYNEIQTNNLPEPTIKNGKKHFGILTYAAPASPSFPITIDGSGGNNGDGELDFDGQPDLVWIKMRNGSQNHILFDSVRGTSVSLRSDGSNSEISRTNFAFATNGFTFSAQDAESYQQNDNYVAWCWKAGGTAVSNTDGDITSSVSANTDAGFSIVKYTGSTGDDSVGHGLTQAPEVIFVKSLDDATRWVTFHEPLGSNSFLSLNNTDTVTTAANYWGQGMTATTFGVQSGGSANNNNNGSDTIAYCWHSVEGFSKFGSYTGNGNADGTFVYLGFKPALIILKSSTSAFDWQIYDSTRSPTNPALLTLRPNQSASEVTSGNDLDILSNGFKARDNGSINNNSGSTYLYMAFAESPFGGENAPPATAR